MLRAGDPLQFGEVLRVHLGFVGQAVAVWQAQDKGVVPERQEQLVLAALFLHGQARRAAAAGLQVQLQFRHRAVGQAQKGLDMAVRHIVVDPQAQRPTVVALAELARGAVAAVEEPWRMPGLPLDIAGTAFQQAVWAELMRIPAGETRTYAQIAAAVGKPKAVRAAGSANGANNVAILIPCHRVIRTDGTLGGYAYGLSRKQALLEKERGG